MVFPATNLFIKAEQTLYKTRTGFSKWFLGASSLIKFSMKNQDKGRTDTLVSKCLLSHIQYQHAKIKYFLSEDQRTINMKIYTSYLS